MHCSEDLYLIDCIPFWLYDYLGMKLNILKLCRSHFAIIPPNQTYENTVQVRRLGFWLMLWPHTEIRQILVCYHIAEDRLIATFHRPGTNVMFYDRESAEKWLGRQLELSPLVDNRIIISDATLQMTFSCRCGKLASKKRRHLFHVPEKVLDHKASIPELEIIGATCKCGQECHLDVHQVGNIHVWVE